MNTEPIDYRGMYEDILEIETRARRNSKYEFAHACFIFRVDLMLGLQWLANERKQMLKEKS